MKNYIIDENDDFEYDFIKEEQEQERLEEQKRIREDDLKVEENLDDSMDYNLEMESPTKAAEEEAKKQAKKEAAEKEGADKGDETKGGDELAHEDVQ